MKKILLFINLFSIKVRVKAMRAYLYSAQAFKVYLNFMFTIYKKLTIIFLGAVHNE